MKVFVSEESRSLLHRRNLIAQPLLIFESYVDWGTYRLSLFGLGDTVFRIRAFLGPDDNSMDGNHNFILDNHTLVVRHHVGTMPPTDLIQLVRCQLCGLRFACLFVCLTAVGIVPL